MLIIYKIRHSTFFDLINAGFDISESADLFIKGPVVIETFLPIFEDEKDEIIKC